MSASAAQSAYDNDREIPVPRGSSSRRRPSNSRSRKNASLSGLVADEGVASIPQASNLGSLQRPPSAPRSRTASIPTLQTSRSPVQSSSSTPRRSLTRRSVSPPKKPEPIIEDEIDEIDELDELEEVEPGVTLVVVKEEVEKNPHGSILFPDVIPSSRQTSSVNDFKDLIENAGVEEELLKEGYNPLEKVIVEGESGQMKAQYIRAINKLGQTLFILIDTDGYVAVNPNDLSMIEVRGANIVPYSMKMGAFESAGLGVTGVAFDCREAICTLVRDGTQNTPHESNFVYTAKRSEAIGAVGDDLLPYPIVRMSEIRASPDMVLKNTDAATRRIRNASYRNVVEELAQTQGSIRSLVSSFNRFNATRETLEAKLNHSMTMLEKLNQGYLAKSPSTDEAQLRYHKLIYNMRKRNDLVTELMRASRAVAQQRNLLTQQARAINEATDHIIAEFSGVDGVIEPRSSM